MERIKTYCFILKIIGYGESDRILHLFTEGYGRVTTIAKGGRKSKKRFSGLLDYFNLLNVELTEKRGTDFAILENADLVEFYLNFRNDIVRMAYGFHLIEIVREFIIGRQPQTSVFHLFREVLRKMDSVNSDFEMFVSMFEIKLLDILGYKPVLERCTACGAVIKDEYEKAIEEYSSGGLIFDMERGGIVCMICHSMYNQQNGTKKIFTPLVSKDVIITIRELSKLQCIDPHGIQRSSDIIKQCRSIILPYIETRIGKRLRVSKFIESFKKGGPNARKIPQFY
jgi:DNA repair protein RecO (recombination protein O)